MTAGSLAFSTSSAVIDRRYSAEASIFATFCAKPIAAPSTTVSPHVFLFRSKTVTPFFAECDPASVSGQFDPSEMGTVGVAFMNPTLTTASLTYRLRSDQGTAQTLLLPSVITMVISSYATCSNESHSTRTNLGPFGGTAKTWNRSGLRSGVGRTRRDCHCPPGWAL